MIKKMFLIPVFVLFVALIAGSGCKKGVRAFTPVSKEIVQKEHEKIKEIRSGKSVELRSDAPQKRGGPADRPFTITVVDVVFFHYISVINDYTGDTGTDWGFGFGLPGGLSLVCNLTAVGDDINIDKPHLITLVGGGDIVEGGAATALDKDGHVIAAGEWTGVGVSLGVDAVNIYPDWD